jgi:hypothetical protein
MRANTLTPIMSFMTRFYRNSIFSSRLFSENIHKLLPLLITGGMFFLINACEEDASKIGEKMLPGTDFVSITSSDTVSVKSYTMYKDSVESDNPATSYLGSMYDPYFGTTSAGFVCQVRLADSLTDEDFFVVDSVKLYLRLLSVKGDTTAEHFLKFSEISQQIYSTSKYYSNQTVPLTGESWSVPLPTLQADTINNIVLNIPKIFGEYMTRNKSMLFMSNTVSDFRSYFKGLYFQIISSGNPVLSSVSVASPGSYGSYSNYFTVYMRDEVDNVMSYDFLLDAKITNAAYNLYKHDFSTAQAGKMIQHINDRYPDTLSYLQNMNGVYTRLEIPSLKTLKQDVSLHNIAINKARLIIPFVTDGSSFTYSTIPSMVYLRYLTTTGHKWIVSDYTTAGTTFYDGTPDTTTTFSYNINIATYLQDYLEDTADTITSDLEMFLLPTSSYNAVLKANASYKPVKFEITYTKF